MHSHLFIGSGGEVGRELARGLTASGEPVFVTTRHKPDVSGGLVPDGALLSPASLYWNLDTPEEGLDDIVRTLGSSSLRSLSIFAHPPFLREKNPFIETGLLAPLSSIDSFALLLGRLHPLFGPGSSVLFFFPSLAHHKADGYLFARSWLGAFRGLFDEWSRRRLGFVLTGIEILITPDKGTPHLSTEMIERISGRTARGRLATAGEIADFAAYLIRSGNPLFHGQILGTEGGPYY